jgi:putative oxidoreductase
MRTERLRSILRAGLLLAFLYVGLEKLLGLPGAVSLYDALGFGQWPRYVTGTVETVSALALLTPLAVYACLALAATMAVGFTAKALIVGPPVWHLAVLFVLAVLLLLLEYRAKSRR